MLYPLEVVAEHIVVVRHGYESFDEEHRCPVCDGEKGSGVLGIIHDGACRLDALLEKMEP